MFLHFLESFPSQSPSSPSETIPFFSRGDELEMQSQDLTPCPPPCKHLHHINISLSSFPSSSAYLHAVTITFCTIDTTANVPAALYPTTEPDNHHPTKIYPNSIDNRLRLRAKQVEPGRPDAKPPGHEAMATNTDGVHFSGVVGGWYETV